MSMSKQNDFSQLNSTIDNPNPSRAGSYTNKPVKAHQERVLFPTHVKESFLVRNKHMANAKMEQMASDFAKQAMAGMK